MIVGTTRQTSSGLYERCGIVQLLIVPLHYSNLFCSNQTGSLEHRSIIAKIGNI